MPGHECFECRAKPDGHARATITKYQGTKGAYWTCRCGAWTFINGPTAKDLNETKQKRGNAQGPRGADGRAPTKPVLGDWQVVRRRKLRRPRTDVDEREALLAPAAKHLPAAQAVEVDDDMPEHDEEVAAQDDAEGQDEEAITKLVTQLELFKGDTAAGELCGRYKEKLRRLREGNAAPRNPALLLLRAQRATKRRAKRGEAARERVRRLEAKVEELLAEAEEARKEVQEAEEAEAEARRQEDAYREEIAAAKGGDAEGRHGHGDTVQGLRLQIAALPEAIRSGNADAAQRAIAEQLDALAEGLAERPRAPAGRRKEAATGADIGAAPSTPIGRTPGPAAGSPDGQTPTGHAPERAAAGPGEQAPTGRGPSPTPTCHDGRRRPTWPTGHSGRRGTSPDAYSSADPSIGRSRSRGSDVGAAERRRDARSQGQQSLDRWAVRRAGQAG